MEIDSNVVRPVSLAFAPRKQREFARPLHWYEFLMPWRWPKSRRTVIEYTELELLYVSVDSQDARMIDIAATHGAVASESGRYYRIENGAAIPTYVVPTYAYVTFTSAGLTMTERVEFELRADRPHDDMLRMLDELHRLTGVAPHEMTVALPTAAIALLRTDRRYLDRFDPWGYDTLGVKAANIADYFKL